MKKYTILFIFALIAVYSATASADTDYLSYKAQLDQKYIKMLADSEQNLSDYNRGQLEQNYLQLLDVYMQGNVASPPASYEQQLASQEAKDLQQFQQEHAQEQSMAQQKLDRSIKFQQQQLDISDETRKQQARKDLLAATDAYKKQDYDTAVQLWQPLAEDGNADAQYGLGLLYDNGRGVPQDKQKSQYWLCKAAKQGNKDAAVAISTAASGTANPNADVVSTVYCGQ